MKAQKFFLLLIFILILQSAVHSQNAIPDTTLYRIETLDGNEYVGKIISRDSVRIYF